MDWTAIALTLKLATITAIVLFVMGVPFAYWLATTRWRGRFLLEAIVALPLVLPPTVVGFYLLLIMGPAGPLGRYYESIAGSRLPFSFGGILIGSILCNIPFAIRPFMAAFSRIDRSLMEVSWCSGVSRFATFRRVTFPLAWPGILAGIVLTFAHTIGEFGVVLMVGGNIPGVTRTLSVSIYDNVQALNYSAANQTAALLVLFAFVVLCLVHLLQRQSLPA
jgi:molybdate transport system permease protein